MSYNVSGTTITLTRGDTFTAIISITDSDGNLYTPVVGDSVRFAMKSKLEDASPLLMIDVPIETMMLIINPEDTKNLAFGKYIYDLQLTKSNGDVDTFITVSILKLTEEVH